MFFFNSINSKTYIKTIAILGNKSLYWLTIIKHSIGSKINSNPSKPFMFFFIQLKFNIVSAD